jgi:hypothetical protein
MEVLDLFVMGWAVDAAMKAVDCHVQLLCDAEDSPRKR